MTRNFFENVKMTDFYSLIYDKKRQSKKDSQTTNSLRRRIAVKLEKKSLKKCSYPDEAAS